MIGKYSYSDFNVETLPIDALPVMKYVQELGRLIKELVIAEPSLGPVYVLKADISNWFYCIELARPIWY